MHGPHEGLIKLYNLASSHVDKGQRPREFFLAELALSSAMVTWWSHLQPEIIHRAIVCGVSLGQISAALGVDELRAYDTWATWADEQAASPISQSTYGSEIDDIHRRFGYGNFPDSP